MSVLKVKSVSWSSDLFIGWLQTFLQYLFKVITDLPQPSKRTAIGSMEGPGKDNSYS